MTKFSEAGFGFGCGGMAVFEAVGANDTSFKFGSNGWVGLSSSSLLSLMFSVRRSL